MRVQHSRARAGSTRTRRPSLERAHSSDFDRELSRSWFNVLVTLAFARSVLPGAFNYMENSHALVGPGETQPWAASAQQVSLYLSVGLALTCALILMRVGLDRIRLTPGMLWFGSLVVYYSARTTLSQGFDARLALDIGLLLLVLVALGAARPRAEYMVVIGFCGFLLATYSIVFGLVNRSNAFLLEDIDSLHTPTKAIINNELLAGPMGHSNTLGLCIGLSLPFLLYSTYRALAVLAASVMVFAIVWSASRTTLIAVGIGLVFVLICYRLSDTSRTRLSSWALSLAGAAVVLVPLRVVDAAAFSGRGDVWQRAIDAWRSAGSPVWGLGDYWSPTATLVPELGLRATTSSGHNLFVQCLVTGGPPLLLLVAIALIMASRNAIALDRISESPASTTYMLMFLTVSVTEFVLVNTVSSQVVLVTGIAIATLLSVDPMPRSRSDSASQRAESNVHS